MPATARPLSPFTTIYRWQIQMVTSILHRATGVALAIGTILLVIALLALAAGPQEYAEVRAFCGSWIGTILLIGWTWALTYHLLNGIRHLLQDIGWGYLPAQFVRNGWLVSIGSVLLAGLIWAFAIMQGGGA